ncbi:TIGR00730 family Rossman fold protein [Demequina muriae]|uniref:Cytokinin riboside 5'-monophosphate phosphoribohydrolase n=1 Tax=Demequina muriae TaxID=3051664 RepID=A0ABT8GEX9_9MICO|nr:TIGR00730 family Rossman fold protein [Demequina sp. EGI L300058]MDN4479985.1 TIGR00730 family Rossman fold protein [Demequina sp. EGI L300058]
MKAEYRKGPVLLRGRNVPKSSTSGRLLSDQDPPNWLHEDPWRVMRIQSEFVEGFGALAELGPAISVFGSARSKVGTDDYAMGEVAGRRLVEEGFVVITGGGPGVMEAANKGASEAGGVSVGLGIELPFEQGVNEYVNLGINFRYFFVRKTMFVKYAQGFIVLPGGFGTFDELFESLTLVQTRTITRFPIVLVGHAYWDGLVSWLRDTVAADGKIAATDLDLIHVTDDIEEAVQIVADHARGEGTGPEEPEEGPVREGM